MQVAISAFMVWNGVEGGVSHVCGEGKVRGVGLRFLLPAVQAQVTLTTERMRTWKRKGLKLSI